MAPEILTMSLAKNLLSAEEQKQVIRAIGEAEKNSSGEIRLHIEDNCNEDLMDHAAFIFEKLNIHKTELRNGVLFYVSINPHGFAILGDVGINQKVNDLFRGLRTILNEEFPSLTKNELLFCCYLKLDLQTETIATLKGVDPASISMTTYRIKKKMALPEKTRLINFIKSL